MICGGVRYRHWLSLSEVDQVQVNLNSLPREPSPGEM